MIPISHLLHYLGAEDGDDDVLLEMERNAVAFVQTQTHRYFGPPELVEELVIGDGSGKLYLTDVPIEAPDDSGYDGGLVALEEVVLAGDDPVATTDFAVRITGNFAHLKRLAGAYWTRGFEYTAVYWRGYSAGSEPGDIRQLVLYLIGLKWAEKERAGLTSETIGGYSWTRSATYAFEDGDLRQLPGAMQTIRAWRRLVYA